MSKSRGGWSIALVVLALAGCSGEVVDQAPAVAVGDGLFKAIGKDHGPVRLEKFYAKSFRTLVRDFPETMARMEAGPGPVLEAKLQSARLAAMDEQPCFVLDYLVRRPQMESSERLFVCREAAVGKSGEAATAVPTKWRIEGHAMERLDTRQKLQFGTVPVEQCVGTNCPAS